MSKPAKWSDPDHKLFPYQVGFTGPPKDWDAAPSDFLRMSPGSVGVHGRLLHTPEYAHTLEQRANNFHLLEDYVYAMSEAGADVVGQVGTNWVHANGTDHDDIVRFTTEMSEKYETPFHMAGLTLVQACQALGYEKIALNSVYFWPDWRDGVVRFLRSAGIDVVWAGNFVDQGFFENQQIVNDHTWIFPGDLAATSFSYVAEQAPNVDAILVNGMCNFRGESGQPQRMVHRVAEMEALIETPILAADCTLYWAIYRTLGIGPVGSGNGSLLDSLRTPGDELA